MSAGRRPPALIYGRNPVLEAINAGRRLKRLLVLATPAPDERLEAILGAAAAAAVPVERVERQQLDAVAHTQAHQGVVAYVERRTYWELNPLLEALAPDPAAVVLVLDGIQDPQNLGSVCRSAEAAGVVAVLPAQGAGSRGDSRRGEGVGRSRRVFANLPGELGGPGARATQGSRILGGRPGG